jgi:4-hydroxy-2-oxoheptanedioate aldolase
VVPQVETVEQARHVVSSSKYGTKYNGTRSCPPFRLIQGLTDAPCDPKLGDLHVNLNHQAAIMIQIETLQGVHNLDDILTAVPDIDIVWLGSLDARISMNLAAFGGGEPEWEAAVKLFNDTCKKHNKPRANFSFNKGEALKKDSEGLALMLISADVVRLGGMYQELAEARSAFTT